MNDYNRYDYAGVYTDPTIDDALCRGMRATSRLYAEILKSAHALSPAEKALADDSVAALGEACKRIKRLHDARRDNRQQEDK